MVKFYDINLELSREFYDKYKNILQVKMCYNNVASIYIRHMLNTPHKYKDFYICYGAWRALNDKPIYARHCFFVKDGKVIDPMFFMEEYNIKADNCNYISVKEYPFEEYVEAINRNIPYVDFQNELREDYRRVAMELFEQNISLIG